MKTRYHRHRTTNEWRALENYGSFQNQHQRSSNKRGLDCIQTPFSCQPLNKSHEYTRLIFSCFFFAGTHIINHCVLFVSSYFLMFFYRIVLWFLTNTQLFIYYRVQTNCKSFWKWIEVTCWPVDEHCIRWVCIWYLEIIWGSGTAHR